MQTPPSQTSLDFITFLRSKNVRIDRDQTNTGPMGISMLGYELVTNQSGEQALYNLHQLKHWTVSSG